MPNDEYPVPKYPLPQNLKNFPFITLLKINLNDPTDTLIKNVNVKAVQTTGMFKVVPATFSFQQLLKIWHRVNEKRLGQKYEGNLEVGISNICLAHISCSSFN